MSWKQGLSVLLCSTMIVSGGVFAKAVNAATITDGQTVNSQIVIGENNVASKIIRANADKIRVIFDGGDKDGFSGRAEYSPKILSNIRFKIATRSSLKAKSVRVTLYSSNGEKQVIKRGSDKVYDIDTTRPLNYKLYIDIKSKDGNTYRRVIGINAKDLLVGRNVADKKGIYKGTIEDIGADKDIYIVSNGYRIPAGSAWYLESYQRNVGLEIAKYSDYIENGVNADWQSIASLVDSEYYYKWKKGTWTIRQKVVNKDTGAVISIIYAPRVIVDNVQTDINCLNIIKQINKANSGVAEVTDTYGIQDFMLNLKNGYDGWYTQVKHDGNYNNIINLDKLNNLGIEVDDRGNKIGLNYEDDLMDIFAGIEENDDDTHMNVSSISNIFNAYLIGGDNKDVKVYYHIGKVGDTEKITWDSMKGSRMKSGISKAKELQAKFKTEGKGNDMLDCSYMTVPYLNYIETLYNSNSGFGDKDFDELLAERCYSEDGEYYDYYSYKVAYKDIFGKQRYVIVRNVPCDEVYW